MSKKYGLIVPEKSSKKPTFQATRNVFGDDSDSEEESSSKKPVLLRPSQNINRQAKAIQEQAITEDPTVYQYDELYDNMIEKKNEVKAKVKEDKKPRYIENLLKSANKRKMENERRVERQVQKEREKEGDEFADKEVFVTAAYKKKLEELRLEEEKEKREEFLESIGDVTKQKDLGGFYRHLYEQKLGSEKKMVNSDENETVKTKDQEPVAKENEHKDHSHIKVRNYRKRKSSHNSDLSGDEVKNTDDEISNVNNDDKKKLKVDENIDADSDFSIDDSSSDEDTPNESKDKKSKPIKKETETKEKDENISSPIRDHSATDTTTKDKVGVDETHEHKETDAKKDEKVKKKTENKPKIDIWKKRTVGEVFEEALKRYYERKAARGL